jgi:hypothetical protein
MGFPYFMTKLLQNNDQWEFFGNRLSAIILHVARNAAGLFRRQIAIPQDHGSWVFILSPLLIGLFAAKTIPPASIFLIAAALASFLLRQPVTMLVKVYTHRRPTTDLPAAWFWIGVYGLIAAAALGGLIVHGFHFVIALAIPGVPIFAWHLWLVSRRAERRQAGVEIVATGVLALAAPAAFWVGAGGYDPAGWWLGLLAWLQSAASIVYAYLRLEQRDRSPALARGEMWMRGRRALAYTSFNLIIALAAGFAGPLPRWTFVPFSVQWLETLWGITHPAAGWKPARIGIRQLIVSAVWTILFIICWRLG